MRLKRSKNHDSYELIIDEQRRNVIYFTHFERLEDKTTNLFINEELCATLKGSDSSLFYALWEHRKEREAENSY